MVGGAGRRLGVVGPGRGFGRVVGGGRVACFRGARRVVEASWRGVYGGECWRSEGAARVGASREIRMVGVVTRAELITLELVFGGHA